jgi:hypothetical protein
MTPIRIITIPTMMTSLFMVGNGFYNKKKRRGPFGPNSHVPWISIIVD